MTRKKYAKDTYLDSSSNNSSSEGEEEIEPITEEEMDSLDRQIYDFIDCGKHGPTVFIRWNYKEPHPSDMEAWCFPGVIGKDGPLEWFVDYLSWESLKHLSRFARMRPPHVQPTHTCRRMNLSVNEFKIILSYATKWLHMNGVYPDKINSLWCMSRIIKSIV